MNYSDNYLQTKGYYKVTEVSPDGVHTTIYMDFEGNQSPEITTIVQGLIDNYNPLSDAQAHAKTLIKEASATQRLKYVTAAAGKDAEYTFKAQEAKQFNLDGTVGIWMQTRINATGETAQEVADIWNQHSQAWQTIGATLAALEDKGIQDINNETDWQHCKVIADGVIAQIEVL